MRTAKPASGVGEVLPDLMTPVGPVVAALCAPVVEVMAHAARAEDPRQAVRLLRMLPRTGAGRQVDVARRQMVQRRAVAEIGPVVDGMVEVEVGVVVAGPE